MWNKPKCHVCTEKMHRQKPKRSSWSLSRILVPWQNCVETCSLVSLYPFFIKNVLCIRHHKNCAISLKIVSILMWLSKQNNIFLGPQICYDSNLSLDVPFFVVSNFKDKSPIIWCPELSYSDGLQTPLSLFFQNWFLLHPVSNTVTILHLLNFPAVTVTTLPLRFSYVGKHNSKKSSCCMDNR